MQIIYQNKLNVLSTCAATVGFFDGVHAGHRFLLDELKSLAQARNLKSTVITFATHPRKVLDVNYSHDVLTSLPEKLIQLEKAGVDVCVVLSFSTQMAKLSASDFMQNVLVDKCKVKTLLVGHDHRFGHNRSDGFPDYKRYGDALGMEVMQAKLYQTETDQNISSSQIRTAIRSGEIDFANRMLTYPYTLHGKVVDGFKMGRKIGFPTANIHVDDPDKLLPALGVYAVRVRWNELIYKGMMNVGVRPTLDSSRKISIEVHIFDFNEDIYNQMIEVELHRRIRNEIKFSSIEELIIQLQKDRQEVLEH